MPRCALKPACRMPHVTLACSRWARPTHNQMHTNNMAAWQQGMEVCLLRRSSWASKISWDTAGALSCWASGI